MCPCEQHHLLEALKVTERKEQVVNGLLNLVFSGVEKANETLHAEVFDHLFQLLVDIRLDCARVRIENRRVHQFVFLGRLKLHAVLRAKVFLHAVELGVHEDLLETATHLIEVVVVLISCAVVHHFEIEVTIFITFESNAPT